MRLHRDWIAGLAAVMLCACAPGDVDFDERSGVAQRPGAKHVSAPLPAAHCEGMVEGVGMVDIEADYLPHVITCENGLANLEALKAQAIAARSVVYYAMETTGAICDSQMCQVYSCGAEPQAKHYQAVQETSGLYSMFNGTLTYNFYVAGDANVSPPNCVGVSGSTEHWVTYNEGKSGFDVAQTELGLVIPNGDPLYGQNRGCMSQNGAQCLENNEGYDYRAIMEFFYGEDIQIVQAQGECIDPVETTDGDTGSSGGAEETGSDDNITTASASASSTAGAEDSETGDSSAEEEDGGTGGPGDDNGLPGTFGGDSNSDDGCGCRTRGKAGWAWLLLIAFGAARRKKTDRA